MVNDCVMEPLNIIIPIKKDWERLSNRSPKMAAKKNHRNSNISVVFLGLGRGQRGNISVIFGGEGEDCDVGRGTC